MRFALCTAHAEPQRHRQRSRAAIGSHANMALPHAEGDAARADSGATARPTPMAHAQAALLSLSPLFCVCAWRRQRGVPSHVAAGGSRSLPLPFHRHRNCCVHVAVAMVRRDHSAMRHAVTAPRMSDWECTPLRRVSALTPAHPRRVVAVCVCRRAHCPRSPLALPDPLTRPPIATPLEWRQCVCMGAQPMPSRASRVASTLPPCDPQRLTQTHAPRPFCHAFECPTVGAHAYKAAVPVFHFLSRARTRIEARLTVRRRAFKGYLNN